MQAFNLENAVNRQSWDWLVDLSRRLDIVVEVLDPLGIPRFPVGSTASAEAVRRIVAMPEPSLAAAVADALHTTAPVAVPIDGFQTLCFGRPPVGVLLFAQPVTGRRSAGRDDLESIGSWLAGAIEASLMNPPKAISEEPFRIASLKRILGDAAASGSPRRVMGAFVEALGVWDNVRIRSYAAGAEGRFVHYVSPVGAFPSAVPAELDDAVVPRDGGMVRLTRIEADRLGLASDPGDVLIWPLATAGEPAWLLVLSGVIEGAEQARLTFYADMLREALEEVFESTARHVTAAMPRHRLAADEPLDAAAGAALERITAAVGGDDAALIVTTVTGIRALAVGNTDLLPTIEHESRRGRMVVASSDTASVMAIVVARRQPPLTGFDRGIVAAALRVLHPWVQAGLIRSTESERRGRSRPLESMFDQLAAKAVRDGQEASVIVASIDPALPNPGLLQSWLGTIRGELRAGDFAGILSDREIAVLLCDTSAEQAAVVCARLKHIIEDGREGLPIRPAFATMTRSPELRFDGSLVAAARADAAALR